jgi:hypothetical protein
VTKKKSDNCDKGEGGGSSSEKNGFVRGPILWKLPKTLSVLFVVSIFQLRDGFLERTTVTAVVTDIR